MTDTEIDASSRFQDSLPLSSDAFIAQLTEWGLPFEYFEHVPLRTVEDSKKVQSQFRAPQDGGAHIKNLFLRDHKKRNVLLVAEQDRPVDLKALKDQLGTGRLSFGSADRLLEVLGVRPGAVTPLSMINGRAHDVLFFMDAELRKAEVIYMHPLVNDRTIEMTMETLMMFFERIGVEPVWVDL